MYLRSLLLSMFVCYCACQHGAHPPGVPPRQEPGGAVHHGEIHHQEGFGVNPHDAEHIKEHLKDVVEKPKEEMTEEELEFHYFKLHDYDGNNKLDGTEITKAITHFHDGDEPSTKERVLGKKQFSDSEISMIVDAILQEDDLDRDGYIEYVEFVTAQRKAKGNH